MKTYLNKNNRKTLSLIIVFVALVIALMLIKRNFIRWYDSEERLRDIVVSEWNYKASTMVVYLDLACPCNAFSTQHLNKLRQQHGQNIHQEIWLDTLTLTVAEQKSIAENFGVRPENIRIAPEHWQNMVPSTPSVLIFNEDSSLGYIGPASDGVSCTTQSSFIDNLLVNLSSGITLNGLVNANVNGCFCAR